MNNSILTIMKKELARFFGDKKVAFSTILLPGLMIFVLYSFMGSALTSQFSVEEDYKAECYVMNFPEDDTLKMMLKEGFRFKEISSEEEVKQQRRSCRRRKQICALFFQKTFLKKLQSRFR